jgi:hypothetical protein
VIEFHCENLVGCKHCKTMSVTSWVSCGRRTLVVQIGGARWCEARHHYLCGKVLGMVSEASECSSIPSGCTQLHCPWEALFAVISIGCTVVHVITKESAHQRMMEYILHRSLVIMLL